LFVKEQIEVEDRRQTFAATSAAMPSPGWKKMETIPARGGCRDQKFRGSSPEGNMLLAWSSG
jgi:hypothetical protein